MSLFKRERKQLDLAAAYQKIFTTEDGVRVLSDLIQRNSVLSSTFDTDARMHAFNEGKREAILRILSILQVDFEKAERLLQGAKEYDERYD